MEQAICVKQLTKQYGNGRGIHDVSFEIKAGEVFGLLGPNGAGKTTVMKIITGLVRANQGNVQIFGKNLREKTEECLAEMGSLIEGPAFVDYMTARQNLRMAARYYHKHEQGIEELASAVGLAPYLDEKTGRYSLGMKQRLAIALALLGEPKILVLDEPSNGLDIEAMVDIRNLILHLAERQRTTFLISSHLAQELQKICTRVGIMADGRLAEVASMEQVLHEHKSLEDYFLFVARRSRKESING